MCLLEQIKQDTSKKVEKLKLQLEPHQIDNREAIFELASEVSDTREAVFELAEIMSEFYKKGGENDG